MFIFSMLLNLSPVFAITTKPGVPSCSYQCPGGYYTTSRYFNGADGVWCIQMRETTENYDGDLFESLDTECKTNGAVLTGFQNKTEFMEVYNNFIANFEYIKDPMVIIGSKRSEQCETAFMDKCSKSEGNKWTDGVTEGTRFFEEAGIFGNGQPETKNGNRMCFGVWTKDIKIYSYNCNKSEKNRPAKLFMCGRRAPCVF